MREFALIARHFAPMAGPGGLGLLDDAALLAPPAGAELVVTTDAVVAGVHFFPDDSAACIGHKALAVNLSDLAAKGAAPLGFQMALMLPGGLDDAWIGAFAGGLSALAREADCPLTGGDTVSTPGPLAIAITAFGWVPAGRMIPRGGASAGDRLVVTGTIGDGAIGLHVRAGERTDRLPPPRGAQPAFDRLAPDHLAFLRERYLRPRARFRVAGAIRRHARAAMDISDGLAGDLTKMVRLSGHGADVRIDEVPLSVAARAAIRLDAALAETALTGGDDYEILAAVPEGRVAALQAECLRAGLPATVIGVVTDADAPVRFLDAGGGERRFSQGSYEHAGLARG
jgi:thiamine-monophosphate kinase